MDSVSVPRAGRDDLPPPHAAPRVTGPIRRSLATVLLVSAAAAVGVAAFAVAAYTASRSAEHDDRAHFAPGIDAVQRLYLALLDQETGLRGYVLTEDETFLEPYDAGARDQQLQIDRLTRALSAEHPELFALVPPIVATADEWRATVAAPEIELVRSGRSDAARAIVQAGVGRELFDRLRSDLDRLRAAIEESRRDGREVLEGRVDRLYVASMAAAAIAALAAVTTWLLARQRVTAPLERLAVQAATVAGGRLDHHITPGGPIEIDSVARSVEAMRVQLLGEVSRAFSSGMVRAEEAERARLAEELHDDPIQVLTSAQWQLEALLPRLDDAMRAPAVAVAASLAEVQARLRTLMFELHPPALQEGGLADALDDLVLDLFDGTATRVALTADVPATLSPTTMSITYRVVAEALRNVRKHAAATTVDVVVRSTGDGVQISVVDDGSGAAPDAARVGDGRHRGTAISRALAMAIGGWWHRSSRPGTGTTVTCWLPDVQLPEVVERAPIDG